MKCRPLTLTLAHLPNLKKKALFKTTIFVRFVRTVGSREAETGLKVAALGGDETGKVSGLISSISGKR